MTSGESRAAREGTAGRRGDKVRSDAWVHLAVRDQGGVEVALRSRVEAYYGDSIREQVRANLAALGIESAHVEIEDNGALPFVLAARVEAAARRAGVELHGDARPERSVPVPAASSKDRLRRSRLYLPGNDPKLCINAGLYGADGVILDLEDSVHPSHKDSARLVVRNLLRTMDFMEAERMVRINPLPLGLDDLAAIAPEEPDVILIPKVEDADTVRAVDERIRQLTERRVWLMPILETALGIERAFDIASAVERVVALTIGLEDYTADLGVIKTVEGTESVYARSRLVNAARAAGCQPIDSVFGDVGDEVGLRSWAERSRALGFEGMGCVHPRQIRPIHEAFAPSAIEIEKALRVVAAFEEAESKRLGVVSLGSKMIDPPVVKRALRTVKTARRAGLLEEESDG